MSKIKHKFKVLISMLQYEKTLWRDFGLYIALIHFFMKIVFQGSKTAIGRRLHRYMYSWIEKKLGIKYSDFIDAYHKLSNENIVNNKVSEDSPIWVFWWQGIEQAPSVVKICIKSIKKHSGKHKVIIVTKDNFKEYAHIPDYIIDKVNDGRISLNHLSDVMRLELLYKHGGIWIDATLWMTGDIPSEAYNLSLFTIQHGQYSDYHVCRGKWSTFFLCSGKHNMLMKFCRDFLYRYLKTENSIICYLIIDVSICLAYDNFVWAKNMIDAVPQNNKAVFEMQEHMNCVYDLNELNQWNKNTFAHKVSYKIPFADSKNGAATYWAYLNKQEM